MSRAETPRTLKEFGAGLRFLRWEHNRSLRHLAKSCGIPVKVIRAAEAGNSVLFDNELIDILAVYGIDQDRMTAALINYTTVKYSIDSRDRLVSRGGVRVEAGLPNEVPVSAKDSNFEDLLALARIAGDLGREYETARRRDQFTLRNTALLLEISEARLSQIEFGFRIPAYPLARKLDLFYRFDTSATYAFNSVSAAVCQSPAIFLDFLMLPDLPLTRDILVNFESKKHNPAQRDAAAGRSMKFEANPGGSTDPGVFISYRRSDEASFAGRLYDRLASHFGQNQVFMDVDSIELGLDFREELDRTLSSCAVMLVVIGRGWLTAKDNSGERRLNNQKDLVRLEVEAGLARNVRIIPILVGGSEMPSEDDLPEAIAALARRHAQEMTHARFGTDFIELMRTIGRVLGSGSDAPSDGY